jgi:hypothetical protein
MKFSDDIFPYLSGQAFSNGLPVGVSHRWAEVADRFSLISERVTGGKVVHVGFTDHIPLIEQKMKRGTWMHGFVAQRTRRCLGIDIDATAVQHVRDTYGTPDIIAADIMQEIPAIRTDHWDYILLGEILEHVDDPVLFLRSIRERYQNQIDRMIITVPNAFAYDNFRFLWRQQEIINSDHRYWFSPYTLAKIAARAGYTIEEFSFCELYSGLKTWKKWFNYRYILNRLVPGFGEDLFMVIRF